jgi:flagellar biogenesis protein FliO
MPPALPPLVLAAALAALPPAQLPTDVSPVLVGIIAVLLLIVFMFFLLIRRTIKSFTEGMREGRQR